ncbi:glycosyltransferase family 2 protein [Chelativorans intermedius]|uniref:Glycosyltransferase family 2 protein n=1 Tax=Chelativorans intermedius TaxID=515947 RepID=A0ABV6D2A0_9HYPH|nr:glycosyltransferase family 2 protein [Chelativorans intermedius]MCT8997412.1 glycosyltransferase family 2 protein [Chelativorans intermedius]
MRDLMARCVRYARYGMLVGRLVIVHLRSPRRLAHALRRAAQMLWQSGPRGLVAALRQYERRGGQGSVSYQEWIALHDTLTEQALDAIRRQLAEIEAPPLISVVMPVHDTPESHLREAIESVRAQIYEKWELCIADDCSRAPHVRKVLDSYAALDPRIKVAYRRRNGHISRASNSAFALAGGEWVAMLDHDDVLRPHALAEVALEIARHPQAQIIYTDEDKIDARGQRYDPYFKPDFSRELFRSQNYLNHLTVHRAANIREVGGWRPGFEGSQDYDLNLRIFERIDPSAIRHIPKVLYHWRAGKGSTALNADEKGYAYSAGLRALQEHVRRTGLAATAEQAPGTPFYRLRHSLPEPPPLVSLIIPTRDRTELLRNCIESIRQKTTYPNYEIIVVDNESQESETRAYLDEIERAGKARILRYDGAFNYSAINNFAVGKANGSIVGLVNNDIEVIAPDWLAEMVSWAAQPDVGCVGAKLYYADGRIQHGGVILGIGGVAGHSHKYFSRMHAGYFSRLKLVQNLSAVTGACLVVRREVYERVGGLDEKNLAIAFNDVDLCLKVRDAGYVNVWTPYAELYHLESVSRGPENNPEKIERFNREAEYMKRKWKLFPDPYYSINLTIDKEDFSIINR